MLLFLLGLLIGAVIGFMLCALLRTSGEEDKIEEQSDASAEHERACDD